MLLIIYSEHLFESYLLWAKVATLLWFLSLIYVVLSWAATESKYYRHHVVAVVTKYTIWFYLGKLYFSHCVALTPLDSGNLLDCEDGEYGYVTSHCYHYH